MAEEPDGEGPTLALNNPDYDNSVAGNWHASEGRGTPGVVNDWATGSEETVAHNDCDLPDPFPNPFTHSVEIGYVLEDAGMVNISIFDFQGKLVDILENKHSIPGTFYLSWSPQSLPPGIYICVIRTNTSTDSKKLIHLTTGNQ